MERTNKTYRQAGFSTLEMLVVLSMSIIITAIAIPGYMSTTRYLRIAGDLRSLNAITAQAKMRAAAYFTHARIFADLSGNDYQLQVWSKGGNCWYSDTDPTQTCLLYNASLPSGSVNNLSQGDTFGFGGLTTGPTPGQATIQQAAQCLDNAGSAINNTACIVFNSRGIPIDNANAPVATGAVYVTNGIVVNGVTVSATGSIQAWTSSASSVHWYGQ